MDGTKATRKTIAEVEKLTGIPKRDLKYLIEQNITKPSQRAENGYWLYSEEDIQRARLAFLCRALGIPVQAIRVILSDPDLHWREELRRHITWLEATLHMANRLRRSGPWEAVQIYYDTQRRPAERKDINA